MFRTLPEFVTPGSNTLNVDNIRDHINTRPTLQVKIECIARLIEELSSAPAYDNVRDTMSQVKRQAYAFVETHPDIAETALRVHSLANPDIKDLLKTARAVPRPELTKTIGQISKQKCLSTFDCEKMSGGFAIVLTGLAVTRGVEGVAEGVAYVVLSNLAYSAFKCEGSPLWRRCTQWIRDPA